MRILRWLICILFLSVTACANNTRQVYAPVTDAIQMIYLREQAPKVTRPVIHSVHSIHSVAAKKIKEPTAYVSVWLWPARGSVITGFSAENKGVNIGGRTGDPVFASAAGVVVYSGDGLRAYGNLVIIKHNNTFLTAYAYNHKVLVKEGEWVRAGEKIAEMGNRSGKRVMLHFEIRRSGQPVNPLNYLRAKG